MENSTRIANEIIKEIMSGNLIASIKRDSNYDNMVEIEINRTSGTPNYGHDKELINLFREGMPDVWECFEYAGTDGCLIYRSNEFCTEFVSVNPETTRGAFRLGKVQTTKGTIDVKGGWSSRPSLVYKYTGIELIEMYIGRAVFYVNKNIATAIGEYLGYIVDQSMYTIGHDDGEYSWAFYPKDVQRCLVCNSPVDSRGSRGCSSCDG